MAMQLKITDPGKRGELLKEICIKHRCFNDRGIDKNAPLLSRLCAAGEYAHAIGNERTVNRLEPLARKEMDSDEYKTRRAQLFVEEFAKAHPILHKIFTKAVENPAKTFVTLGLPLLASGIYLAIAAPFPFNTVAILGIGGGVVGTLGGIALHYDKTHPKVSVTKPT